MVAEELDRRRRRPLAGRRRLRPRRRGRSSTTALEAVQRRARRLDAGGGARGPPRSCSAARARARGLARRGRARRGRALARGGGAQRPRRLRLGEDAGGRLGRPRRAAALPRRRGIPRSCPGCGRAPSRTARVRSTARGWNRRTPGSTSPCTRRSRTAARCGRCHTTGTSNRSRNRRAAASGTGLRRVGGGREQLALDRPYLASSWASAGVSSARSQLRRPSAEPAVLSTRLRCGQLAGRRDPCVLELRVR